MYHYSANENILNTLIPLSNNNKQTKNLFIQYQLSSDGP